MNLSDGEKLILFMLGDLFRKLNIKNGEIDGQFVIDAIAGGHLWALNWKYSGVFHGEDDKEEDVNHAVDILEMWSIIEASYKKLKPAEKKWLEKEAEPFGKHVKFHGFDGNNETALMSIARFLVEKMGRFSEFRGRDFNSHMPSLPGYRRMLKLYRPIRDKIAMGTIKAEDLAVILKAQAHPGR